MIKFDPDSKSYVFDDDKVDVLRETFAVCDDWTASLIVRGLLASALDRDVELLLLEVIRLSSERIKLLVSKAYLTVANSTIYKPVDGYRMKQ